MTRKVLPVSGQWYRESARLQPFRVTDLSEEQIEIEYQDGDVEQITMADWESAKMRAIPEPENLDSFREIFDLDEPEPGNNSWEEEYPDLLDTIHMSDDD